MSLYLVRLYLYHYIALSISLHLCTLRSLSPRSLSTNLYLFRLSMDGYINTPSYFSLHIFISVSLYLSLKPYSPIAPNH